MRPCFAALRSSRPSRITDGSPTAGGEGVGGLPENSQQRVLERKARLQLQQLIADGNTPQKIVKRARIILMAAAGHGVMAIMREVGVSKTTTVWRWQEYFAEAGVAGLVEGRSKPPGRKPISAGSV